MSNIEYLEKCIYQDKKSIAIAKECFSDHMRELRATYKRAFEKAKKAGLITNRNEVIVSFNYGTATFREKLHFVPAPIGITLNIGDDSLEHKIAVLESCNPEVHKVLVAIKAIIDAE